MSDFDATLDAWVYADDEPQPDSSFDPGGDDEPFEVGDWLPGETIEERNARIRSRDAETRQADRFAPVGRDVIDADGHDRFDLTDAASVRAALTSAAADAGMSLAELVMPLPRGRLTAENRGRRDVLARGVATAQLRGATLFVVGEVTGRSISTVHLLGERGHALLGV